MCWAGARAKAILSVNSPERFRRTRTSWARPLPKQILFRRSGEGSIGQCGNEASFKCGGRRGGCCFSAAKRSSPSGHLKRSTFRQRAHHRPLRATSGQLRASADGSIRRAMNSTLHPCEADRLPHRHPCVARIVRFHTQMQWPTGHPSTYGDDVTWSLRVTIELSMYKCGGATLSW